MDIQEKLQEDLKQAMRSGDQTRKSVIRYVRSEIKNQEIASRKPLDDEGVTEVLSRQARQRRESIEAFREADRQDLVDKESAELAIIQEYLPEPVPADELRKLAVQAIEETGAQGPQDTGKIMGRLMPQLKGKADGREVSQLVSRLLKELAG